MSPTLLRACALALVLGSLPHLVPARTWARAQQKSQKEISRELARFFSEHFQEQNMADEAEQWKRRIARRERVLEIVAAGQLARIIHQPSAATSQIASDAALFSLRVLDDLQRSPPVLSVANRCLRGHLWRFARSLMNNAG